MVVFGNISSRIIEIRSRHSFVVIGGKDVEGNPLSDVWVSNHL